MFSPWLGSAAPVVVVEKLLRITARREQSHNERQNKSVLGRTQRRTEYGSLFETTESAIEVVIIDSICNI